MPSLNEHASTVLTEEISQENIELETAAWIEYYLRNHGRVRHVWCSPKDRPTPWVCTLTDGTTYTVEPKGGCPKGHVFVM